jgi:hypothetical protein
VDRALQLSVPSRTEYIAVVRLVVSSLVSARRALADERIDDLKLVWEAPERLEVCIADSGRGFDPDQLPEHPPVTDPERLNFERGLGIPIIRTLVDDVRFESGDTGTSVWMTLFGGPSTDGGDETAEILRVVLSDDT